MYAGAALAQPDAAALRPPREAAPPGEHDDSGRPAWGLPPIRWGGSTTSEVRLHQSGDQRARLQHAGHATIRAASYIGQPWLAQVGATLGFLSTHASGGGGAETPGTSSSSASITGSGTLALFPLSRFPFNAYVERNDSRASGEMVQNDTVNTRFGVRQSYTPADGRSNYSASFDRSTLSSAAFGLDTVNALAVNANRTFDANTVDLAGGYTSNLRSNTGERTRLGRVHGRHRYQSDGLLSVETLASLTRSEFHLVSGDIPQDNRSHFIQASSFATWRPGEDSPLFVTGGGRYFQSRIELNGTPSESRTLVGNVGASYALTSNTTLGGSATVAQAVTAETSDLFTSQTANATHVSSPLNVRGFLYTWNAAANLANNTSTRTGSRRNFGGQLGHNITRDFGIRDTSVVTLSAGQNVNSSFDTVTSQSTTLGHNANLTWRLVPRANTTGLMSLLGSDSRTYGHNANRFQLVNAQATGQLQLNRYSFAAANLTVQAVRHSTPLEPATGFSWMKSGSFSYQHVRAFDVPRLRYFASYNINDMQLATRLQGDVSAQREQVSQSLEQRLEYNIGRIEIRLSARVAVIDGKRSALIYLRIGRQFGDF